MTIDRDSKQQRPRRRRIVKEEARVILFDATITLLRQLPFDEVTNSKICAEADLNPSTILQHFGSLSNLLAETARELIRRHLETALANPGTPTAFSDPDVALRNRLVAWLILNGHDPASFRSGILADETVMNFQKTSLQVDERMAAAWTTITTLIVEGFSVFESTHDLSTAQRADVLLAIIALRNELPVIEKKLDWA
jgi:AcrR family transcriptional regulator